MRDKLPKTLPRCSRHRGWYPPAVPRHCHPWPPRWCPGGPCFITRSISGHTRGAAAVATRRNMIRAIRHRGTACCAVERCGRTKRSFDPMHLVGQLLQEVFCQALKAVGEVLATQVASLPAVRQISRTWCPSVMGSKGL